MFGAQTATTLVVVLLHLFSPIAVLNAIAPTNGITQTRAVSFGTGPRRLLDIYAPRRGPTPAPVIVFFYGGGWETGAKEMYRFVGAGMAALGVIVVIPDYRLYPEVRFPEFMDDPAAAVAWTLRNAERLGGDPHRLFLMGHSAGGQIATLLALDPRYLHAVGVSPDRDLCGVIGLAAPYDFLPPANAEIAAILGQEADWPRSQPINFVTPEAPPMLLLAGRDDRTVDPGNTLRLAARLRGAGVPVTAVLYPQVGHTALIAALSGALAFLAPARAAALSFVSAHGACGR
jgi:acetyl esterase/lipase